jgi:hypothetical protein
VRSRIEIGENMSKKPKPPPDDPEQSAKFVETARSLGADKGELVFGKAIKRLLPLRRRPRPDTGK